ncbi:hypothetical protein I4U23_010979 [Adineta vaga]|nr:hypothetical protein I4U23_010979 [Adineta vaga]
MKIVIFLTFDLFLLAFGIPISPPVIDVSSSANKKNSNPAEFVNKWPNGIVPYDVSAITNAADRLMIENATHHIMYDTGSPIANSVSRNSCVHFRPRVGSDTTYVTIVYGQGCNAHAGYWPKYPLKLTLQKDAQANCFTNGVIQHELLHVLGFKHEHQRPDRDNHVQINYANIDSQWHYAFDKQVWGTTAVDLKTNYDYGSIMHYGKDYFSKNGLPTIVPKQANVQIGNREKLSPVDILEVRQFYGCKA